MPSVSYYSSPFLPFHHHPHRQPSRSSAFPVFCVCASVRRILIQGGRADGSQQEPDQLLRRGRYGVVWCGKRTDYACSGPERLLFRNSRSEEGRVVACVCGGRVAFREGLRHEPCLLAFAAGRRISLARLFSGRAARWVSMCAAFLLVVLHSMHVWFGCCPLRRRMGSNQNQAY